MTLRALPRGRSTLSPAHLFRFKGDAPSRQAPTDPHHRRSTGAQPGLHSTITHLFGVPSTIIFRPEFRRGEATRTPRIGEAMKIEEVAPSIRLTLEQLTVKHKGS
jgi:hypothetical protein